MKKLFNSVFLTLAICAGLSFTSCKDSDAVEIKMAAPTKEGFNSIRTQALKDLTQTKTFKAEEGITFTSNRGTQIAIFPNCLLDNAYNPVSGEVTLSFIEMYERGDMVMTNKPLLGRDNNGDLAPLVTGGQYNLQVFKGDQALNSGCHFTVSIKASNTGGLDDEMILWNGIIGEDGNLAWEEVNREEQKEMLNPNAQAATYDVWGSEFGWTNIDRFYNDPRPKTQIKVAVPSVYNHNNSAVYLAYDGEPNILAQLDTYDNVEHYFSEHYGFVPIGMSLHVIFVSESNGSVVYAIKRVTIAANATITISESELNTTSRAQLIEMINTLK